MQPRRSQRSNGRRHGQTQRPKHMQTRSRRPRRDMPRGRDNDRNFSLDLSMPSYEFKELNEQHKRHVTKQKALSTKAPTQNTMTKTESDIDPTQEQSSGLRGLLKRFLG